MTWPTRKPLKKLEPLTHATVSLTPAQSDSLRDLANAEGKPMSKILQEAFEMLLEAKAEAETQRAEL